MLVFSLQAPLAKNKQTNKSKIKSENTNELFVCLLGEPLGMLLPRIVSFFPVSQASSTGETLHGVPFTYNAVTCSDWPAMAPGATLKLIIL